MIWGTERRKATIDVKTRLNPLLTISAGSNIVVRPITPKPAPTDMFPRLSAIASMNETFLTRPVLSRVKTFFAVLVPSIGRGLSPPRINMLRHLELWHFHWLEFFYVRWPTSIRFSQEASSFWNFDLFILGNKSCCALK